MPKAEAKRSGPKRSKKSKGSASKARSVLRRLQNDVERKRSGDRKLLEDAFRAGERVGEMKKHHKKKSAKKSAKKSGKKSGKRSDGKKKKSKKY